MAKSGHFDILFLVSPLKKIVTEFSYILISMFT